MRRRGDYSSRCRQDLLSSAEVSDDLHNGSSPYARAVNKAADALQVYLDFGRTARGLAHGGMDGMRAVAVRHFRDSLSPLLMSMNGAMRPRCNEAKWYFHYLSSARA
jgi:hypothetical protein